MLGTGFNQSVITLELLFSYFTVFQQIYGGWIKLESIPTMIKQRDHSEEDTQLRIISEPRECGMYQ